MATILKIVCGIHWLKNFTKKLHNFFTDLKTKQKLPYIDTAHVPRGRKGY